MRIVIIEDEKPAAEKLTKALLKQNTGFSIEAVLDSNAVAEQWFATHSMPDLLFMDIELSDGLSFQLLDKINITCPIIFCTAYDEYWQEAFEHNGIDYLLKPMSDEKLQQALNKYETLKKYFAQNLQQLLQSQQKQATGYKKRFLVKRGSDYISIKTENIAYFYATHKLVCMVDQQNQKFILDQSLADLEKETDPSLFYRVNRKYLVNVASIQKIKSYPKSKLELELRPAAPEEVIISQESAAAFKEWMGS
nr:LytTR family DNA-binding domain-containing protein [uncultured Lacibacter sp.]